MSTHQNTLAGKGLKSMGTLLHSINKFDFKPKILCQLFDAFVGSILNYSCEVWNECVNRNSSLSLYKYVKTDFQYLGIIIVKRRRHLLTRLRVSAHKLRVDTGRYGRNRLERKKWLCVICNSTRDVEDEYHFS